MLTHNSFPRDQIPAVLTGFLISLWILTDFQRKSCEKWQLKASKVKYHFFQPKKESKKYNTPNSMAKWLVRHDTLHVVMDWAEAWRDNGVAHLLDRNQRRDGGKTMVNDVMDVMRESAPKDITR